MTRNIAFVALSLPLLLAACGTPQERCIRKYTSEYRYVSRLLAETEANLARGYSWQEREVTRSYWGTCREYDRDDDGNVTVNLVSCERDVTVTERFRVAIDPVVEERKRENLSRIKTRLAPEAETYVEACQKAFPDEEELASGATPPEAR